MTLARVTACAVAAWLAGGSGIAAEAPPTLGELVERVREIRIETLSAEEYRAASAAYGEILAALESIPEDDLEGGDAVDAELLAAHLETRRFEIDELRLHELVPIRYFRLSKTNSLFSRPCAQPDRVVREAVEELRRLPRILGNGKRQLTRPARVWTENAMYVAWYAERMLDRDLATVCVDDADLKGELAAAGEEALAAVRDYAGWLERELLPRSDRSPAWKPEEVEFYQFVHERLDGYGVDAMLAIAAAEEAAVLAQMEELARRIHPSGDLRTVWELMKSEAPPWSRCRRWRGATSSSPTTGFAARVPISSRSPSASTTECRSPHRWGGAPSRSAAPTTVRPSRAGSRATTCSRRWRSG